VTTTFEVSTVPEGTLAHRIPIIDVDTHIIEPPDLWTSRVSVQKWGDRVPHVRWDEVAQRDSWFFGDRPITGVATSAMAFWGKYPPEFPQRLEEVDPANWDALPRLRRMDELGIHAQVLYPNVAGFGSGQFTTVDEPELTLELVRAYNDFLADYASAAPNRFIPVMAVPFWDIDAAIAEIRRAAARGHRGLVLGSQPEYWGAPDLTDRHWDPLWATAEELGLPINFHIAAGDISDAFGGNPQNGPRANFASASISFFVGNARAIARIIFGGICHRFPGLNFVSVESGVGWLPFALEAMDWQWKNCGVAAEHLEYELLPSEYFRRQIYGCFWFEEQSLRSTLEVLGPDNLLYESDFPHPTSMTPGPASAATEPWRYVEKMLKDQPEEAARKLLHDNAAKLYGMTGAATR
jgi:predicted TIM-barrel fold metal-dependent hydrolase